MSLAPEKSEILARARADLRIGLPVIVRGPGGAAGVVAAVETISAARVGRLRDADQCVVAITNWRAETLKARAYDGDLARVILPSDADLTWLRAIADPARDLEHPMKGPLHTARGGETAIHRAAITLCKAARVLPAALVAEGIAAQDGLTTVAAHDVIAEDRGLPALRSVVSANVPLALAENARLHVFRPESGADEHYAIEIGRPDRDQPVLSRLHSACFTGDLLGSLKCDCGPQLRAALAAMGQAGAGVLLYLNQEGRGIGLANKMRAYALQDQGFDTVDANHRLGFEDDERDFRLGAQILTHMGFSSVRLMTNNPAKVAMLTDSGIAVTERVALRVGQTPQNARYLSIKAQKSGHLL